MNDDRQRPADECRHEWEPAGPVVDHPGRTLGTRCVLCGRHSYRPEPAARAAPPTQGLTPPGTGRVHFADLFRTPTRHARFLRYGPTIRGRLDGPGPRLVKPRVHRDDGDRDDLVASTQAIQSSPRLSAGAVEPACALSGPRPVASCAAASQVAAAEVTRHASHRAGATRSGSAGAPVMQMYASSSMEDSFGPEPCAVPSHVRCPSATGPANTGSGSPRWRRSAGRLARCAVRHYPGTRSKIIPRRPPRHPIYARRETGRDTDDGRAGRKRRQPPRRVPDAARRRRRQRGRRFALHTRGRLAERDRQAAADDQVDAVRDIDAAAGTRGRSTRPRPRAARRRRRRPVTRPPSGEEPCPLPPTAPRAQRPSRRRQRPGQVVDRPRRARGDRRSPSTSASAPPTNVGSPAASAESAAVVRGQGRRGSHRRDRPGAGKMMAAQDPGHSRRCSS